jgi:S-(hydroxymethyl)glutathione dehydrogenase/alcohol dehydrogenase
MRPKKIRAAVLVELNAPLQVAELDLPPSLAYGQVLVRVHFSGICGAQLNEIEGVKGPDPFLPHLLGHEGSATVLEVGEGVRNVAPGDRVVLHWRQGAGIQAPTPAYGWNGRRVNAGWVTTFNDHAIVSENRVTPVPADFDLRLAPLFGCAVTTAFGVIHNDAQLKVGQSVVVFGAGGVGLATLQAASLVCADPVIAVDIIGGKLEMARRFGATHGFEANKPGLEGEIRKIVGADGADVVIDTTGQPRVIEQAYALTHAAGRTILVGVPRKGDNVSIYTLPLHFGKILRGSHGGGAEPHRDIPRYVRLVQRGKLRLDGLITHELGLDDINEAIDVARSGAAGRVLVAME